MAAYVLLASVDSRAEPAGHVRVFRASDQPIADQLLPDDEIVVVTPDYDVAVPDHTLNAAETVIDATTRADVVAVVDVNRINAVFVDKGAWIRTQISGVLQETIKISSRVRPLYRRGKSVTLNVSGGELQLGRVLIRAGHPLRLRLHSEYLLFMKDHGDLGLSPTHTPLVISNGRLVDTLPPGVADYPDPLVGLAVDDVKRMVRSVPKPQA